MLCLCLAVMEVLLLSLRWKSRVVAVKSLLQTGAALAALCFQNLEQFTEAVMQRPHGIHGVFQSASRAHRHLACQAAVT